MEFNGDYSYEKSMGTWSALIGNHFIYWLRPPLERKCLDVGCGNGAFSRLITAKTSTSRVVGVDPSPEQVGFANKRDFRSKTAFQVGDATNLHFSDNAFDVAVMALGNFLFRRSSKRPE